MIFLKILFIGTAVFGIPILEKILENKNNEVSIISQPDKPQGRAKKIIPNPVKRVALEKGIPIFQPDNINSQESIKKIKELRPDIILVVAYGQILRTEVLTIPERGCINIHASLLPAYRGAAPINWAIINGEKETGITFIMMNEKVDAGEIIFQKKVSIYPDETYGELSERLSRLSGEIVNEILEKYEKGELKGIPQDKELTTCCRKMKKEDGKINWEETGERIYNLYRGTTPYPGAFTFYRGKKIKIVEAKFFPESYLDTEKKFDIPGMIVKFDRHILAILTGDRKIIRLLRLIPEGSKEMNIQEFINGYRIKIGDIFGN